MRPLPAALLVVLAAACSPSERSSTDTAAAIPVPPDTTAAAATATPLPAAVDSSGARPAPAGAASPRTPSRGTATTGIARDSAADSAKRPRIEPPTKAPGGTILLPPRVRDSLRMRPPSTATSTATRP